MNGEIKVEVNANKTDIKFPDSVVIIPIMSTPIFPGMVAPIILSEDKFSDDLDKHILKSGFIGLNLVKSSGEDKIDPEVGDSLPSEEFANEKNTFEEMDADGRVANGQVIQESQERQVGNEVINDGGEDVVADEVYRVGLLCKVVKKLRLPDGTMNIIVHGIERYRASEFISTKAPIIAKIEVFKDILEADEELDAYTRTVINQVKKLSEINPYFNEEMKLAMFTSSSPGSLADLVAFSLSLDIPEAQDFLETLVVKKRFAKLLVYLKREKNVADIQKKISDEVNNKVNKYQREYFLREQLKVIRNELGMEEDEKSKEVKRLKEKIEEVGLPEVALKAAREEVARLEVIPDSSPEYNLVRTYLSLLIELPWKKASTKEIDIETARKILEHDHYGLEKPKERILEFLAVRKLKPQYDGTILCLAGPPGVGKTSLGKSIARALGRNFFRFSLGGMRDEAEIKGHRRTYVGAMPGRIIQALKRVEVNNPVIMLDEIDKLGKSFQGDPASALLEVLDPEQNVNFMDHYLEVPFDLSKVLFIATANYINDIPEPLLDRMEIIELSGYTLEEKISIAKKWVIPKQIEKHGLTSKNFELSTDVIKKIISDYAREPGVRTLEQVVAKLCRKAALERVSSKTKTEKKKRVGNFVPQVGELEKHLGSKRFHSEHAEKILSPGVVIGLAWTAFGGEILYIETIPLKGQGFKLTGQIGEVMHESASIAYSFVRRLLQKDMDENQKKDVQKGKAKSVKNAAKQKTAKEKKMIAADTGTPNLGTGANAIVKEDLTPRDFLASHEIHLHIPAGATPKDGPSAGIAMGTALYGLATNRRIKANLAMTGELSLTGRVMPVGGIKEKVLGAKRAGIHNIILPKENEKDVKEVPERHRAGVTFYFVSQFEEVLNIALNK